MREVVRSPIVVPAVWWGANSLQVFLENVQRVLPDAGVIVDFGAGRGRVAPASLVRLMNFRSARRSVIGIDVDPAIHENEMLDRAIVWDETGSLPLADASVDMVVSLAVFEHVKNAELTAKELTRILKPGAWLCAWTPHRWSYVAVLARIVPNLLHWTFLRVFQPDKERADTFPTHYRMNTAATLGRLFPEFEDKSYGYAGFPSYTRDIALANRLVIAWESIFPGRNIHVFKRKL
jgi:SAM-dependent methyltransferase